MFELLILSNFSIWLFLVKTPVQQLQILEQVWHRFYTESARAQIASLKNSLNESQSYYEEIITDYYEKLSLSQYGYLVNNMNLTQDSGAVTAVWSGYVEYAGYVVINVESTSNTTCASVAYSLSSRGINFDYNATVGTSGTTVFPVLPGDLTIGLGNTETVNSINATVSAVYYY